MRICILRLMLFFVLPVVFSSSCCYLYLSFCFTLLIRSLFIYSLLIYSLLLHSLLLYSRYLYTILLPTIVTCIFILF
jgi:hypothetical protein